MLARWWRVHVWLSLRTAISRSATLGCLSHSSSLFKALLPVSNHPRTAALAMESIMDTDVPHTGAIALPLRSLVDCNNAKARKNLKIKLSKVSPRILPNRPNVHDSCIVPMSTSKIVPNTSHSHLFHTEVFSHLRDPRSQRPTTPIHPTTPATSGEITRP